MTRRVIKRNRDWVVDVLEPTANATDQAFSNGFQGLYLMTVEIVATIDDAVTFTINSEDGTVLFTTTTTAATSGEISAALDR